MSSCQSFVVVLMLVITGVGFDVLSQGLLLKIARSSCRVERHRCRPFAFVSDVAALLFAAIAAVCLLVGSMSFGVVIIVVFFLQCRVTFTNSLRQVGVGACLR